MHHAIKILENSLLFADICKLVVIMQSCCLEFSKYFKFSILLQKHGASFKNYMLIAMKRVLRTICEDKEI